MAMSIDEALMSESITAGKLQGKYMKKRRKKIYVALEDIDFVWDTDEIKEFIKMWNDDVPISHIAKVFNRSEIECVVLVMDLSKKDRIQPRANGLF
ncbi:helix-turn-helix domain-containing protein [Heyndrickxia ginsengihumi]|uniref:helix-turn-helix domain-containing protein n=1 Tax=Heyndrickxia ginsengihumi TaxID=363870 RepID=UPI003D2148A8